MQTPGSRGSIRFSRDVVKVRWWQLGSDQDAKLVGYPRLVEKTQEAKQHLERYGQEVKLAVGWQWHSPPPAAGAPLAVQNLISDPQLTATGGRDLSGKNAGRSQERGSAAPLGRGARPLPKSDYSLTTRAHDLVARMLAAKLAKADGVFVSRPFSRETGLMEEDGTPGELFLPWRTTAVAVTGSDYIGQMQLPGKEHELCIRPGESGSHGRLERPAN